MISKNMDIKQRMELLKVSISEKRFLHSVSVMETAVKLAKNYNFDVESAETAGLLHDCARDIRGENLFNLCRKYGIGTNYITEAQPELLHGTLGYYVARDKYCVQDLSVLEAIKWHTTGKRDMTNLEKVIYLADVIEPGRKFDGVEDIRKVAYDNLDKALLLALDRTLKYVIMREVYIHPETIEARNSIIYEIRVKNILGGKNE